VVNHKPEWIALPTTVASATNASFLDPARDHRPSKDWRAYSVRAGRQNDENLGWGTPSVRRLPTLMRLPKKVRRVDTSGADAPCEVRM